MAKNSNELETGDMLFSIVGVVLFLAGVYLLNAPHEVHVQIIDMPHIYHLALGSILTFGGGLVIVKALMFND